MKKKDKVKRNHELECDYESLPEDPTTKENSQHKSKKKKRKPSRKGFESRTGVTQ